MLGRRSRVREWHAEGSKTSQRVGTLKRKKTAGGGQQGGVECSREVCVCVSSGGPKAQLALLGVQKCQPRGCELEWRGGDGIASYFFKVQFHETIGRCRLSGPQGKCRFGREKGEEGTKTS